jgi:hypothetical protein
MGQNFIFCENFLFVISTKLQYFQFELYMALLYIRDDLSGIIKKSMASLFVLEILELFQNYLDLDIQTGIF